MWVDNLITHGDQAGASELDIRSNLIRVSGADPGTGEAPNAIFTNQGLGSASNVHFYRNTTIGGRIRVRDSAAAVGPYTFTRNVIVNEDVSQAIPHICDGVLQGENMTSYGPATSTPRGHKYAQ